jgi:hypothetical protein
VICSIVRGGTFVVSLRGDATAGTEESGARDSSPRTNRSRTSYPTTLVDKATPPPSLGGVPLDRFLKPPYQFLGNCFGPLQFVQSVTVTKSER